jgi:hypothetical protein
MKIGKNFNLNSCRLSSHLFMPPLFEIEHCSIAGRAGFVGLFIGLFYIDCLNIADTNNHRCRPRKDNRHKKIQIFGVGHIRTTDTKNGLPILSRVQRT